MRQVLRLIATGYQKKFETGRTVPAVFACEDSDGNTAGEYVVKFGSSCNNGVTGLACELVASLLADELGLSTPAPAVIELTPRLAQSLSAIDANVAQVVSRNVGLNFGSEFLAGGYITWPIGKSIPTSLEGTAAEIFAFDAFIENPDRRIDKPNLLWRNDEIFVIDHEMAFSSLYALSSSDNDYNVDGANFDFLILHVFFNQLKEKGISLTRFVGALSALSDEVLEQVTSQVPQEWNSENLQKMMGRLKLMISHSADFGAQVQRRLQ